jgi:hypothetical protein
MVINGDVPEQAQQDNNNKNNNNKTTQAILDLLRRGIHCRRP